MKILQVSGFDRKGGAEAVALGLHRSYLESGMQAWLCVRKSVLKEKGIITIPEAKGHSFLAAILLHLAEIMNPYSGFTATHLKNLARPRAFFERWRGHEDFEFPSSRHLTELTPQKPDILHLHNLHGGYFDLRQLPRLSQHFPTVITLHDSWLASGHCAFSFDCDKWRSGCGNCPDLTIYPPLQKDGTSYNWNRKRSILSRSKLYVASPSEWLLDRMKLSILAPAIQESKVIYNSIDDVFFQPLNREVERQRLGLRQDQLVLLFAANTIRNNEWKDFACIREAAALASEMLPERDIVMLALGEAGARERIGSVELRFLPFQGELREVAACYQAADIYLHASRVETFSLTIAEAQASGTPVIASHVGAVSERIRCLSECGRKEATGLLTPQGDGAAMARAIAKLATDPDLACAVAANAKALAERSYRRGSQTDSYLSWFSQILEA